MTQCSDIVDRMSFDVDRLMFLLAPESSRLHSSVIMAAEGSFSLIKRVSVRYKQAAPNRNDN